jgi:hypothetical protein
MKPKKKPVQTPPDPPPEPCTVREKLDAGLYKTKFVYPERSNPQYTSIRNLYRNDEARLQQQFKMDLFSEHGVTGHPKAELCYAKAWEHGHAYGLSEVATYFEDFVELIQP